MTPEQRHANMAAIRCRDTKPERLVRRYLWAHGFRYRLNHSRLPGKPDVVLRKYRTCIFINGCFWHGHTLSDGTACRHFKMPRTNQDYWQPKIQRNQERDIEVQHRLAAMGWHCITIWECELLPINREATLQPLTFTLNHIYLNDNSLHRHTYDLDFEDTVPSLAAEEQMPFGENKQAAK